MTRITLSLAVFLGYTDAVELTKRFVNTPEPDAYNYRQFGHEPDFWHDMQSDPFFANTWRFADMPGHAVQVTNETAYLDDSPADYYFPTGVAQWEPDALVFLGESIGEALEHPYESKSLIERLGMTEAPVEDESNIQLESSLGWNNKPWKEYLDPTLKGYQWDQSSIPKIYKIADSASYLKPYSHRDHSWNDAEYNQSDEVKFLDNTKTLHADYLENLATAAEYHLREGRTGVAAADEV
jgi:hypothetical protein